MGWGNGIGIGWPNATSGGASPTPDVLICNQYWTIENLDVTTYRDGTPIPEVTDPVQWAALTTGAWCYYNNDPSNGAIYGKLYNWYAVNDIRGLAPEGYHIPSETEWATLTACLGGDSVAGGALKSTGTTLWTNPNTGATNSSGFTGLPGRSRDYTGVFSIDAGDVGFWWSSTTFDATSAWYHYLYHSLSNIFSSFGEKNKGLSVRLVKN